MNNSYSISSNRPQHRRGLSIWSLAFAAVVGVYGAAGFVAVNAQATAGSIFGKAPAGDTVLAKNITSGSQRHVKVDSKGRYTIGSLPIGTYTVTLEENDNPVAKHLNVEVAVGRGSNVSFDCAQGQCGELASKP